MVSYHSMTEQPELVKLDLQPIFLKMLAEGETIDGDPVDPEIAGLAYRRFLTLRRRHPDLTLVPSATIDAVWHYHILDTRKYIADCTRIYGTYLHHDPYFGLGGEEEMQENQRAWEDTKRLWESTFGEPMIGDAHRCSSKDCR